MIQSKKILLAIAGLALAALSAQAGPLTVGSTVSVTETGVSPFKSVSITSPINGSSTTINVAAGVTKLLVDGIAYDSFCIDPFQYSNGNAQSYQVAKLDDAPLPYYEMSAAQAATISKLWALNYSPAINADNAALLQIAIWEVVGGVNFTVNNAALATAANALINAANNSQTPGADLLALTSRSYQDYVVRNVPDGGVTIALLGLALLGLAGTRKLQAVRARD